LKLTTDRHEASRGLFATAELLIFDKKKANCTAIWHDFEKDAALLQSILRDRIKCLTVEKQNERLSTIAIQQ